MYRSLLNLFLLICFVCGELQIELFSTDTNGTSHSLSREQYRALAPLFSKIVGATDTSINGPIVRWDGVCDTFDPSIAAGKLVMTDLVRYKTFAGICYPTERK
jgi:hypothetical protein